MIKNNYIVATIKNWHINEYKKYSKEIKVDWHLITNKSDLTVKNIQSIEPKYIFFPHWSWIVPKEITDNYNCICFHMTNLPHGRGGSPLQNLIIRGHKKTKITAFKMTQELDAGDIYLKHPLNLSGSAQDIFIRSSRIIADMIKIIVEQNLTPKPQSGKIVEFSRRTPEQSIIPDNTSLEEIYNHIRMLDAPKYPKAYIKYKNINLIFDNAHINGGKLSANVEIEINNE